MSNLEIQFRCPWCSQLLSAPIDKSGLEATCPYCDTKLCIPDKKSQAGRPVDSSANVARDNQVNATQEIKGGSARTESRARVDSNRKSWWAWMFGPEPPEEKNAYEYAKRCLANTQRLLEAFKTATAGLGEKLATEIERIKRDESESFFNNIPVDRLGESIKGLRIDLLRNAGYETLGALYRSSANELIKINGIGRQTVKKITNAVRQIRQKLLNQPFRIPQPNELTERHRTILSNAYVQRRLLHIPKNATDDLCSFERKVSDLISRKAKTEGLLNRMFRRSSAEAELARIGLELKATCIAASNVAAYKTVESTLDLIETPTNLEALVRDYKEYFADYTAIIEKAVDATRGETPTKHGRHGGLPKEIADAVDSTVISVDGLKISLRAYQEFGIKYLVHQQRTVLGDEMGLGKTIQALGAIIHVSETEGASRFLTVAPASILGNWQREIEARTSLKVRLLHGRDRERNASVWIDRGGVALTSYATLSSLEQIGQTSIDYLIVDEAHYAKNPEAKRSQAINSAALRSKKVVLMTGTPLENCAMEFVNLIRICEPSLSSQLEKGPLDAVNAISDSSTFERNVAPVYLRRNQEDVLHELPEVMETEEWLTMSARDWAVYDKAVLAGHIMRLRQAANGVDDLSSKMRRFAELVDQYRIEKKKLVVFSFFKHTLAMCEEIVGRSHRIDGSIPANRRMEIVDQFNGSREFEVLVSQIQAGGVGLNLQSASVVVLMEPQFKPTTEWQAIKRVHRMGQTERVMVHRLLATDTVDERLRELVQSKAVVFDEYARESAIKNATASAVDSSDQTLTKQILDIEAERYHQRKSAV